MLKILTKFLERCDCVTSEKLVRYWWWSGSGYVRVRVTVTAALAAVCALRVLLLSVVYGSKEPAEDGGDDRFAAVGLDWLKEWVMMIEIKRCRSVIVEPMKNDSINPAAAAAVVSKSQLLCRPYIVIVTSFRSSGPPPHPRLPVHHYVTRAAQICRQIAIYWQRVYAESRGAFGFVFERKVSERVPCVCGLTRSSSCDVMC